MKSPNRVQRFAQRLLGIQSRPISPDKVIIKSWKNRKNPHLLENGDKVLFDTEKGTYIATYVGGDENKPEEYKDPRIFSN